MRTSGFGDSELAPLLGPGVGTPESHTRGASRSQGLAGSQTSESGDCEVFSGVGMVDRLQQVDLLLDERTSANADFAQG
eukprot:2617337-Alexandrium_andersonii.AAC.1